MAKFIALTVASLFVAIHAENTPAWYCLDPTTPQLEYSQKSPIPAKQLCTSADKTVFCSVSPSCLTGGAPSYQTNYIVVCGDIVSEAVTGQPVVVDDSECTATRPTNPGHVKTGLGTQVCEVSYPKPCSDCDSDVENLNVIINNLDVGDDLGIRVYDTGSDIPVVYQVTKTENDDCFLPIGKIPQIPIISDILKGLERKTDAVTRGGI